VTSCERVAAPTRSRATERVSRAVTANLRTEDVTISDAPEYGVFRKGRVYVAVACLLVRLCYESRL
jgi:hypothetical protein